PIIPLKKLHLQAPVVPQPLHKHEFALLADEFFFVAEYLCPGPGVEVRDVQEAEISTGGLWRICHLGQKALQLRTMATPLPVPSKQPPQSGVLSIAHTQPVEEK